MQGGRVRGATRVLGKSQGYFGLPVLDQLTEDGIPMMTTAWFPVPAELDKLAKGAPIYVRLIGSAHPPIKVEVGAVPSEDADADG